MEDYQDWLINREESTGYVNCKQCSKQYMCNKEKCTGLIKFSQTKGYGIPERKDR